MTIKKVVIAFVMVIGLSSQQFQPIDLLIASNPIQFLEGAVYRISWAANGNSVAVATPDSISVYSDTFNLLNEFTLIDGTLVYELALSSNGNYLAGSMTCQTCNTGDVIKIWDIQANSVLTEFEILSDERNPLIWNDSENLLAYMDSRNLFIWDRTTGSETLLVESRSIVDMAWLTDSTLLVADIFGNLLSWNITTAMSTEIYTQESGFYSMDLDPSKQFVAINYIDGSIIALLNLMTGEVEGTLVGLEDLVYEISWGTAGVAAIDTSGSQIIVWNPDTQSVITTIDTINLTRDVEWIPNQPAITYSGQANDGLPSIANISTARGTSFFCSGKAC